MHFSFSSTFIPILGGLAYERIKGCYRLRYIPWIRHPRTYHEKVLNRKFFNPVPNSAFLSDKWRVRQFVKERVGERILNEVYSVVENPDDINFDTLPSEFVIKMNNASARNIFVTNKISIDQEQVREQLRRWLAEPFGTLTNELWYLDIQPMIMIEKFLRDETGQIPSDYKIHVFHGRCEFIELHANRYGKEHNTNYYDAEWNPYPLVVYGEIPSPVVPRPANLQTIIEVAERLGRDFDYVRVDVYSPGKNIIFGEMTLAPATGHDRFVTKGVDRHLGSLW